ncbi:carbohydrate ABC transporter permease [Clostridium oryzae]|uniref:L-arabinose transport system permease protein AraQ n=1 Tax=Clostridium oryzae TaxID=1450648 RepID=A0A1V4IKP4_9CLOT|nr:carbohydrate ABC transporter permease [Clostridium oryzae]OPJ60473.1 L-arabinose transport system permease protein AraQ [Clostridium oryzae]
MAANSIKKSTSDITFNIIGYVIISILTILCLVPFWLIISGSFTSDRAISKYGFSLMPKQFSLQAYRLLFDNPGQILKAYGVSIMITLLGTLGGIIIMSMAGYVLHRKDFKNRNKISFFIYFTTLFNGGLVPWYILITKYLALKDSYLVLIIPGMASAFNILLVRNFMSSIPEALIESAKIDGAGDFLIYWRIVLPLAKPVLATVGLFLGLGYWNDWFMASLFIKSPEKYPLQYLLYKTLQSAQFLSASTASNYVSAQQLPTESLKMATAVVATGPIILLYPFVQRYFVQGITIGAVKG